MTERLSLANALADAKIERSAAERIATEIFDAIHDSVATKADIATLKADLQRVEGSLRSEMELLEYRLPTRLGSIIVVAAGVLFAALRYLPATH